VSATIAESTWLILLVWLGLLALSIREKYYGVMGSLIGVLLGFILMGSITKWFGLIFVFLNIYVFYHCLFSGEQK
jgi:nicotinamide riboside transporter PnuC